MEAVPGARGGLGETGRAQEVCGAVRLLCMMRQWWLRAMCLSKPMKRATLRVNLNVNCGLWATRLCPRRLLDGDSRTAAVWVPGVGQVCGNCTFHSVGYEPNAAPKIKFITFSKSYLHFT